MSVMPLLPLRGLGVGGMYVRKGDFYSEHQVHTSDEDIPLFYH
jgi:hypothetical protein